MLKLHEISCKTLLNKSTLTDFTLNCYVGYSHLEAIFRALEGLNLGKIYVDRAQTQTQYSQELKTKTLEVARQFNLSNKVIFCF